MKGLTLKKQESKVAVSKAQIDLRSLFLDLQQQMIAKLSTNRRNITHPGTKGDASELSWLEMFDQYFPKRYRAEKAFVLDVYGNISDQIDIVVFDRQYSPFLFNQDGAYYVPAESVYAVIEVKQELNKEMLEYAASKAASVRKLYRTTAPIPHAGGVYRPKKHFQILSGILALESAWDPPFGTPFNSTIRKFGSTERIDLGCALRSGAFELKKTARKNCRVETTGRDEALIFFFLRMLSRLQSLGTVPALDISKYAASVH
jgi:hypothetical protein